LGSTRRPRLAGGAETRAALEASEEEYVPIAEAGSQHWMQLAVNRHPDVLLDALRRTGAVSASTTIDWASPLESANCCEYRDRAALRKAGIDELRVRALAHFWPPPGPVWDAIGNL